ncbi:hypothetical protein BsWGS_03787 [Bradybaena similaris]
MNTEDENSDADTIIYDAEEGYIKSLEDLAAQSIIDETEIRPPVKHKESLPAAPDGGYAWVVCCGVFINHMLYEGTGRAEGLFFLQFQSQFGASAQLAAWPGSLMSTVKLFMGPPVAAVVNRYSVRTASFIGALLSFAGMLLNSFAPNIYFLFLSHTLLGGVGRGLMSGVLILNLYFDKHRSLATGLASSGIGMGSLWAVPLVQVLFDEYGFKGACLILSGLLLNGVLVAMLYRPLRMHYRFMTARLLRKGIKTRMDEFELPVSSNPTSGSDKNISQSNLAETGLKLHEKLSTINENAELSERNEQSEKNERADENEQPEKSEPVEAIPLLEETSTTSRDDRSSISSTSSSSDSSKDTLRIKEAENSQPESNVKEERVLAGKKGDTEGCLRSSLKIFFPVDFKREGEKRTSNFHWGLLKHGSFLLYCNSSLLFLLSHKIAFVFLPAIAMSKGLSRQEAALILTVMGGVDMFARIFTGFLMDLRSIRPYRQYVFTSLLFVIALDTMMIPFLTNFASFCIVCSLYGFLTGAFVTQKFVFLVDILGREKVPSGLGIQKVFSGVGTLVGPPLAGAFRDALGNYNSSFYLGAASMIVSALLMTLSVMLIKIRNRKSAI